MIDKFKNVFDIEFEEISSDKLVGNENEKT